MDRLPAIKDAKLFTGFNWYASYPAHFAGDPTGATPELGKLVFDFAVQNIAKAIKAVKEDDMSSQFIREFADYGRNPRADLTHI